MQDFPIVTIFSGDYIEGETPVPIPNTAVKPLRADGTARVGVWESRSLPGSCFSLALRSGPPDAEGCHRYSCASSSRRFFENQTEEG